jgi:tetratricopeptide (TPR) repeat protein
LAGGKDKKGEMSDAFASFFGDDDFSWLDEEDEGAREARLAREADARAASEAESEEEPASEPVAAEPEPDAPVAEEPVAAQGVADDPVVEEAVVEEAVVEEAVVEEPVAEPSVAATSSSPASPVIEEAAHTFYDDGEPADDEAGFDPPAPVAAAPAVAATPDEDEDDQAADAFFGADALDTFEAPAALDTYDGEELHAAEPAAAAAPAAPVPSSDPFEFDLGVEDPFEAPAADRPGVADVGDAPEPLRVAPPAFVPPAPPPPPPDAPPHAAGAGPTFRLDALLPRAGLHRGVSPATMFDPGELDVRPEPAPLAETHDPELDQVYGDITGHGRDGEPPAPVVSEQQERTARVVLSDLTPMTADPASVGAGFEGPPEGPSAARLTFVRTSPVPVDGPEVWAEVVKGLESEASTASGPEIGPLLAGVARVHLLRLGDPTAALRALGTAAAAGTDDAGLRAQAAEVLGEPVALLAALDHYATALVGERADDVWRRAASVAREHEGDAAAVKRLRQAVKADPTSVASWWALRDLATASSLDEDRAAALESLAELIDPPAAAVALRERGLVLSSLGRDREAIEALRAARKLDAASGGLFRTLESWYLAQRDHSALAALYTEEAGRWPDDEAAWWWLLAARAHRTAGESERATDAFALAVAAGSSVAPCEQQAWLALTEQTDALCEAIAAEAEAAGSTEAAGAIWLRLALTEELVRGDLGRAVDAYRRAAELGVAPAAAAVGRVLSALGDRDAQRAFLEEQVRLGGVGAALARVRLAEIAEAADPGGETALAAFAAVVGEVSVRARALRGHARVALRRGLHAVRAESLEALAALETVAERACDLRVRALFARQLAGGAAESLAPTVEAVSASSPLLALDVALDLLDGAGKFSEVAALQARAAGMLEGSAAADRWLDVARLRSSFLHDRTGAVEALQAALAVDGGHSEASALLLELAGGLRSDLMLEEARRQAAAGGPDAPWYSLTAAIIATLTHRAASELEDVGALAHPAMRGLLAARAHAAGAWDRVAALLEADGLDDVERLLSWVLSVAGRDPERARAAFDGMEAPDRAVVAAARVAERLGNLGAAVRIASGGKGALASLEASRLAFRQGASPDQVAVLATAALSEPSTALSAALTIVRGAGRSNDDAALAAAHARVASLAESSPLAAAHALVSAFHAEAAGDSGAALEGYKLALAHRGHSIDAATGLRVACEAAGDVGALHDLFDAFDPEDVLGRAESIERAGADAVQAWQAATVEHGLYAELSLEVALARQERWHELFERLSERRERMRSLQERERVESRRRWVLAEKLADTEEAWSLYQRLHEEHPEDRDVLENLARIAGARGDDTTAILHLIHLAEGARDPEDAARYMRRVAEVHLREGRSAEARQAFLDALDHRPDDVEALEGLKQLARASDDWQALSSVLEREAVITTGPEQVRALRQLAEITEAHVSDLAVVIDAWRRVLAGAPGDQAARRSLLEVADRAGDHELFLQTAAELEPRLEGSDRASMLRRMGLASEALSRREDAIHHYEQAVSAEEPDAVAAERLEFLYRDANDWSGVVRALKAQAAVLASPGEQAARLVQAARVEIDVRHDRDAAARVYEDVLQADPEHIGALQFLAAYYYEAGRYEDALPLCERLEPVLAATDDLDDFDERMEQSSFFFRYAEMLRTVRRDVEAMARYERALELNPTHLPTLEAVGPLRVAAKQWDRAGEAFERILQLTGGRGEPQQVAQTYTMLGVVEYHRGNIDKAYKRFNKALESFQNHVPALRGLARIMEDRKDWNGLLTVYNNVIYHATVQDFIDAYLTKGRVLDEELHRQDKAIQHYERSLSFYAEQPGVLLRLAEIHCRSGSWEEVAGYAVRGIEVAESSPQLAADLQILLALARSSLGDERGAGEALAGAMASNPELGTLSVGELPALLEVVRGRLPR